MPLPKRPRRSKAPSFGLPSSRGCAREAGPDSDTEVYTRSTAGLGHEGSGVALVRTEPGTMNKLNNKALKSLATASLWPTRGGSDRNVVLGIQRTPNPYHPPGEYKAMSVTALRDKAIVL